MFAKRNEPARATAAGTKAPARGVSRYAHHFAAFALKPAARSNSAATANMLSSSSA
jgi:hypothetical protein